MVEPRTMRWYAIIRILIYLKTWEELLYSDCIHYTLLSNKFFRMYTGLVHHWIGDTPHDIVLEEILFPERARSRGLYTCVWICNQNTKQ